MSQEYQFNFHGMARLFDDLKYIVQKGGSTKLFGGGDGASKGEMFLLIIKIIGIVILIIIIAYISFIIIFGGYMRFLVPALFHTEDMDGFIRENNILTKNLATLLTKTNGCSDPYAAYEMVFKQSTSEYRQKLSDLNNAINDLYSEFKYDEKVYEAFKDFYLYFDKIDVEKQTIEKLPTANGTVQIKNKELYEQMLGYFINKGRYQPEKKSDDQQLIDIHNLDQQQKYKYYNRIVGVKSLVLNLAAVSSQLCNTISTNPYSAFLALPENSMDVQAVMADLQQYDKNIADNTIFNLESTRLNDYSWYIVEYKYFLKNQNAYSTYEGTINSASAQFSQEEIASIRKYINITPIMKKSAESKLFSKTTPAFFEFVKKHPIFSHVYFNKDINNANKATFYTNLMQIYNKFATCGSADLPTNLMNNGRLLLTLINSIVVFDMYLNRYRPAIMKTYQNQNYADKFFFTRLFNPYMEDFVSNRMGSYAKKTFSGANWDASFDKFTMQWGKLGEKLKDMMKSIVKSFNTSVSVEKPQSEDPNS